MILLLGGGGYVGKAFQLELQARNIDFEVVRRYDADYSDEEVLTQLIESRHASFLINAAGFTGKPNVDACELQKAECLFGNSVLPGRVSAVCKKVGISWGHVSSGCIFTGANKDGSGFTEDDGPNFTFRQNNCSFYSGSKALGEEAIASDENAYVWRLRIPFNHIDGPRNYLSKLMRYPRLLDAVNSISHLGDFVSACINTWQLNLPRGIYNVTNPGKVTTREVVEMIASSGVCEKKYEFFSSEEDFMECAAKTPRSNCVMSSEKLESFGVGLRPVRAAISEALQTWVPEKALANA